MIFARPAIWAQASPFQHRVVDPISGDKDRSGCKALRGLAEAPCSDAAFNPQQAR